MSEDPIEESRMDVEEPMTEAEKKRFEARQKRRKKVFEAEAHKGIKFYGGKNDPMVDALNKAIKSERIRNVN